MNSFTIIFSNRTSNGNYFTKLQRKGSVTTNSNMGMFGNTTYTRESSETYFVFGSTQMQMNTQIQLNPSQWTIELKDYQIPGGDLVQLKYLAAFNG